MTLPRPEFGQALPPKSSPDVIRALWTRRSSPAPTLAAPGPTPDEMELLITLGLRVPDHGKIGPWRVVRFSDDSKAKLVEALERLAKDQPDPAKAVAALRKLSAPPEALLIIACAILDHPIPVWEQHLSAAAVCQNLLIAAGALGYGANWITDWYSYAPEARNLLGLDAHEQVAGFIFLGTPTEAPLERERPDPASRVSWWQGGA